MAFIEAFIEFPDSTRIPSISTVDGFAVPRYYAVGVTSFVAQFFISYKINGVVYESELTSLTISQS